MSQRAAIETQNRVTGRQSLGTETQSRATETLGRESRATERVGTRQTWDHQPAQAENPR